MEQKINVYNTKGDHIGQFDTPEQAGRVYRLASGRIRNALATGTLIKGMRFEPIEEEPTQPRRADNDYHDLTDEEILEAVGLK